jgi:hypothetical protein
MVIGAVGNMRVSSWTTRLDATNPGASYWRQFVPFAALPCPRCLVVDAVDVELTSLELQKHTSSTRNYKYHVHVRGEKIVCSKVVE